jgi:Siphovirus Gp157
MNAHFAIEALKNDIDQALLIYPELADDEQLRADFFEGQTNLDGVVSMLLDMSIEAKTMALAVKTRKQEIAERQARLERKEDACRNLIKTLLERAGINKLALTEANISLSNKAPSPIVTDESLLPDDCVKIERKPSMTAIKAALEAKREVQGVVMSNGGTTLTIRTK